MSALLTLDDVIAWKRERDACVARVVELEKKLQQAAPFMPKDALVEVFGAADIAGEPKPQDERSVVSIALQQIAEREMRLLSAAQFETLARSSDAADIVVANPGVVKEILNRLARHGRLRKRGDYYMNPDVPDNNPPRNTAPAGTYGEAKYFRKIVLDALRNLPYGAAPSEIIEILKSDERGARKIEGNIQYPYSLLGRMVNKNFVVKAEGKFYHPDLSRPELFANNGDKSETAATRNGSAAAASESPEGSEALPDAARAAQHGLSQQSRH